MVDGELTVYVERGGKTLLTWSDDLDRLGPAAEALADAARRGSLGRMTVESADGTQLLGSGSTPGARGAPGRRLPGHSPRGLRLACLRATPSSAPPGCSTAR